MDLFIKNMVCDRCKMVVKQTLKQHGLAVSHIALGQATVAPDPGAAQLNVIATDLRRDGFELLLGEKERLTQRIKDLVIGKIHYGQNAETTSNMSDWLATQLDKDYASLSRLFSESEGLTLEKFIIRQKIERVKELLQYGELNLNQIALEMNYSSSAHLSAQFKQVTGLTPSRYKASQIQRTSLDKI